MSRYARRRNPSAYCGDDAHVEWSWTEDLTPKQQTAFDALSRPQTRYALEALQQVFARMPWGQVFEFSDGRRGRVVPFYEPRWRKGARGSTELVEGGFDVQFSDGGHLEFQVEQSGWETPVRANPQAKLEHRDLLTGQRVRPGTPGSLATGAYVMRIRPGPGEPFEVVEVDREDLDPAKDTFGVSKETYDKYRRIAGAQARQRDRELRRAPSFEPDAELRVPGSPATFRSASSAASEFVERNPSLWNLGWADVADQIEDWMDRTEIRIRGGKYRALDETRRGREILSLFRSGRNDQGLSELLAYLFGQAKGRRYENVPWSKIEGLVDVLAEAARREADRVGSTDFLSAGIPTITWMPPATGFHAATPEYVEQLDERGRVYYRRYEASQHLYDLAERLKRLLHQGRKCLTADQRRVVRERIKTIKRWAKVPDEMPEWACAVFREPGVICGLLGIEEEAARLSAACDTGYDPDWPRRSGADLVQPGLGVIPSLSVSAPPSEADLDLPWETAANPRRRRRR